MSKMRVDEPVPFAELSREFHVALFGEDYPMSGDQLKRWSEYMVRMLTPRIERAADKCWVAREAGPVSKEEFVQLMTAEFS